MQTSLTQKFLTVVCPMLPQRRWRLSFSWPVARGRAALVLPLSVGVLLLAPAARAQVAYALTTLHTFSGSDGSDPNGPLVLGGDGDFYGTTVAGGANNLGTIFRLTPAGAFTTLYSFTGGSDGKAPSALALGRDGKFYGTTSAGGADNAGAIFRIDLDGVFATVYSFTAQADGAAPVAPLFLGGDGNFYGTTANENFIDSVGGTVFQFDPGGTLTTLFNFFSGQLTPPIPFGVVRANDGTFYITEFEEGDGPLYFEEIYEGSPTGTLTELQNLGGGSAGYYEQSLILGSDGNLYGATSSTAYATGSNVTGTVFTMTPAGVLTVLHNFTGPDGALPNGLLQGTDGNFYGTTSEGGANGYGTSFEITPAGALTTLHSFTGGSDGDHPNAALVEGSDGSFYGTTTGPDNFGAPPPGGTIFKLTAVPALPVVTITALQDELDVSSGKIGHFKIVRQGGDLTQPLTVLYRTSGAAVAGVDYRATTGWKTIEPGQTEARIDIVPEGDLGDRYRKRVRVALASNNGYTLGTSTFAYLVLFKD